MDGVQMSPDGTAAAVLSCPMNDPNDADAATIRDYLIQLLLKVWVKQDEFSGKAPFGNSGWTGEIEMALIAAGLVDGRVDEDGYIAEVDDAVVDRLVVLAIAALGAPS